MYRIICHGLQNRQRVGCQGPCFLQRSLSLMLGSLVSLSHMLYIQYMIIYPSPAAPMIRREGKGQARQDKQDPRILQAEICTAHKKALPGLQNKVAYRYTAGSMGGHARFWGRVKNSNRSGRHGILGDAVGYLE